MFNDRNFGGGQRTDNLRMFWRLGGFRARRWESYPPRQLHALCRPALHSFRFRRGAQRERQRDFHLSRGRQAHAQQRRFGIDQRIDQLLQPVANLAHGMENIPILGINCGHLGFLAEVTTDDVDDILRKLVAGEYTIEQRSLLRLTVADKAGNKRDGLIMAPNALNEIAILKEGLSSMLQIELRVNGELLHTYNSDGLVIATPTGSTAYNLSIGGPLMVPQSRGIIITPIAPHSLTVKPIVVPDDWKFDIRVSSRYDAYMVSVDGRSQSLGTDLLLHIERAPYTVKLVQIGDNSFLKSLRTKLNWGK